MVEGKLYCYGKEDGNKGIEATYILNGNILQVNIAGSNHWTDYLKCLRVWPRIQDRGLKYHKYFYEEGKNLSLYLINHLKLELAKRNIIVKVEGFSLGGSLAKSMYLQWPRVKNVISINAPKIGNKLITQRLKSPNVKIYGHKNDLIHRFPFFYAKESVISYGDAKVPFWKAHNIRPITPNS